MANQVDRRTLDLAPYEGKWVAVYEGRIIAVGDTSGDLGAQVRSAGLAGEAVAMYVPRPTDEIAIGVRPIG